MSKDCFVTKLKGVVNDSTLARFGELSIKVSSGTFQINNSTSDTLIRSDKDALSLVNGGSGVKSVTVPKAANTTSMTTVYVTQDCTIFVPQYELNRFSFTPAEDVDMEYMGASLEGGTYITILQSSAVVNLHLPKNVRSISNSMCTFDLDFNEYPNLIAINGNVSNRVFVVDAEQFAEKLPAIRGYLLWSTADNSGGSFDDWGICKSLVSLKGYHGGGSMEGFVAKQRAVQGDRPARTTGSVVLQYCGTLTFNGNPVTFTGEKTLSWTATTITFDGTTITA